MPAELIISISGMRGIVGENLTPSVAADYGCTFGTFLKGGGAGTEGDSLSVCIGRDSRPSGEMLSAAITDGLCRVGVDVVDLGLVTTPSVGIMVRHLGCAGGVVITASHNPIEYNGIKLLLGNGMAPRAEQAEQIRRGFLERKFAPVDSANRGKVTADVRAEPEHIRRVLAIIDRETIAARKSKVVLDSVNGAGGPIAKKLLTELGCEISAINDEPTGRFAHAPEPLAENLGGLCEAVRSRGSDIGFAQDPDADRLAIVDENGTYIGEEYTLALAAKHIFSKKTGRAATNLSTSRMIDDVAGSAGCQVIRTPVGETNVASAMLEHDCIIGGEGNGGIIDLRVGPIRDSLVGIALVLQLMAETGQTVSQLVNKIGGYYMTKDKFAANQEQAQQILDMAKEAFRSASGGRLNTSDGCRFDFADGWLHVRASNTEPVMRVIVEAKDQKAAQKYIDQMAAIRTKALAH